MTLKNVWGVSLKGINDLEDEVLVPPESRFRVTHVDSKSDPNYSSGYGGCGMDFITLEMENPDIYKRNFYQNTGVKLNSAQSARQQSAGSQTQSGNNQPVPVPDLIAQRS